jgi:translation initiation factor IF-2
MCRSSWRSTRWTSRRPIRTGFAPSFCSTRSLTESMGGDVIDVEVSALKLANLDKLLEMILLQAEVLELKANPDRTAEGVVIEASSIVAAVRLRPFWCRPARSSRATFSLPVPSGAVCARCLTKMASRSRKPARRNRSRSLASRARRQAGDMVAVVENEARAREIAEYRQRQIRDKASARHPVHAARSSK